MERLKRKWQGVEAESKPEAIPTGGAWVFIAGTLFIILGVATIINHKWPFMFTPIQLDMIALPLAAIFGQTIGAFLAGSLCLMLGAVLLWGALNEERPDN